MSVTDPFPLNYTPKVNSPQLLAWLAQFGDDKFVRAEDFNQIFQALQFLYENMGGGGTFNPADYDLDAFQNLASDPYVRLSQVLTSADLQAVQEGISWKTPGARLYLDTPIPMNGVIPTIAVQDFQGVTLVNDDRVVLPSQANQIFNGIYRVNTGLSGFYRFYRTNDANTTAELNNATISIAEGTHANETFRQQTVNPVIGTSNIVFDVFGATVPSATNLISGIAKLYNAIGTETDGGITPNAVKVGLEAKQENAKLISANHTAVNNDNLIVNATCTITDVASPSNGTNYTATIVNGSVTIGGVVYGMGVIVKRIYNSGAWKTCVVTDTEDWTDFSGTSIITGFVTPNITFLRYRRTGKAATVRGRITGVSNSLTGPTLTHPFTTPNFGAGQPSYSLTYTNNSVSSPTSGLLVAANNSNLIQFFRDGSFSTNWSNTGTLSISFEITFIIQ